LANENEREFVAELELYNHQLQLFEKQWPSLFQQNISLSEDLKETQQIISECMNFLSKKRSKFGEIKEYYYFIIIIIITNYLDRFLLEDSKKHVEGLRKKFNASIRKFNLSFFPSIQRFCFQENASKISELKEFVQGLSIVQERVALEIKEHVAADATREAAIATREADQKAHFADTQATTNACVAKTFTLVALETRKHVPALAVLLRQDCISTRRLQALEALALGSEVTSLASECEGLCAREAKLQAEINKKQKILTDFRPVCDPATLAGHSFEISCENI
jgi:hypothetical protein